MLEENSLKVDLGDPLRKSTPSPKSRLVHYHVKGEGLGDRLMLNTLSPEHCLCYCLQRSSALGDTCAQARVAQSSPASWVQSSICTFQVTRSPVKKYGPPDHCLRLCFQRIHSPWHQAITRHFARVAWSSTTLLFTGQATAYLCAWPRLTFTRPLPDLQLHILKTLILVPINFVTSFHTHTLRTNSPSSNITKRTTKYICYSSCISEQFQLSCLSNNRNLTHKLPP